MPTSTRTAAMMNSSMVMIPSFTDPHISRSHSADLHVRVWGVIGPGMGTDSASDSQEGMRMATDDDQNLHKQVLEVLLAKVEQDPFPSVTMMNMIEEILEPED